MTPMNDTLTKKLINELMRSAGVSTYEAALAKNWISIGKLITTLIIATTNEHMIVFYLIDSTEQKSCGFIRFATYEDIYAKVFDVLQQGLNVQFKSANIINPYRFSMYKQYEDLDEKFMRSQTKPAKDHDD